MKLRQQEFAYVLLDLNADTEATDKWGKTPLLTAVMKGDMPMVDRLLQVGADVEASDLDFKTPLILAAELGRATIVTRLLEGGASIDKRDRVSLQCVLSLGNTGKNQSILQLPRWIML